jgi:hypothetical protein
VRRVDLPPHSPCPEAIDSAPDPKAHDIACAELAHYKLGILVAASSNGYSRVTCTASGTKLRCGRSARSTTSLVKGLAAIGQLLARARDLDGRIVLATLSSLRKHELAVTL